MAKKKKRYSADLGYNHNQDDQPSPTYTPKEAMTMSQKRQKRGKKGTSQLKAKAALLKSLRKRGYFKCG